MKRITYLGLLVLVVSFAACTIHFPYEWEGYDDYAVVLHVNPDDAEVLLDGKLIGTAYEFANASNPLKLRSRNHELVIKKQGFKEELVNLHDYSSHNITVRLTLLEDKRHYSSREDRRKPAPKTTGTTRPTAPKTTGTEKTRPAYTPQSEPVKEPPKAGPETTSFPTKWVKVSLEVEPLEASIYLNGKFWGIAPDTGKIENIRLKAGDYSLEVIKPGYKSVKKLFSVKDADLKLSIKLQKS